MSDMLDELAHDIVKLQSEIARLRSVMTEYVCDCTGQCHAEVAGGSCGLAAYAVLNFPGALGSFQARVEPWLLACFGKMIAGDREERNHRFLEEALELVQSLGCTAHEARQLVDYVYGRPIGEPHQEVGGTMVTLAALCWANELDMHQAGEIELVRIWTKVEAIRAKQAAKPKHSPLPQHTPQPLSRPIGNPITWALFHVDANGKRTMADWRLFPSKEAAEAGIGQQPECFRAQTTALGLAPTPVTRCEAMIEAHQRYLATVRIRRDHMTPVKPECEVLDGTKIIVMAAWQIDDDDGRYAGEWAMQLHGDHPISWIASGDLTDIQPAPRVGQ